MKTPKFVICIENSDYPASLEVQKLYQVIPDSDAAKLGQIRIIDESGEDYLYPSECFIDARLTKSVETAVVNAA